MASGAKLSKQLDVIKSLSSVSETQFLLIGTYELLPFWNLNGQLSRRENNIHFPRYNLDNSNNEEIFRNILWTFQKHIPLESEPDLINYVDFFYERSIGCIGILKSLLSSTYKVRMKEGAKTISIDDFQRFALPTKQCLIIAKETIRMEYEFMEKDDTREELRSLLFSNKNIAEKNDTNESKHPDTKKNRVGERKPKRDEVG